MEYGNLDIPDLKQLIAEVNSERLCVIFPEGRMTTNGNIMKIYEFSTWGAWESENKLFGVAEIEVEEKPKCYKAKNRMILKKDVGILQNHYGDRMYLLENNPMAYVSAIIDKKKNAVEDREKHLKLLKNELKAWEAMKERF